MKKSGRGLWKRSLGIVLAGSLLTGSLLTGGFCVAPSGTKNLWGIRNCWQGQSVAYAAEAAEAGSLLFEEFESGSTGAWSGKDGAVVSVVSDQSKNGASCMKISGRKATYAGARAELKGLSKGNYLLKTSAFVKYTDGPEEKRVQMTVACNGQYYGAGSVTLKKNEWGELSGSLNVSEDMDLSHAVIYFETPWTPNPKEEQDFMDLYVDDVRVRRMDFCDTSSYPSLKDIYKDQFLFGTAVPAPALGNKLYSNLILQQFSSMTMENEMKPQYVLDEATCKSNPSKYKEEAALNFDSYRTGLEYAKAHGIQIRGHVLVWHSQTPDWFFYENYDTSGQLASKELMKKRMENYIKDVISWTETNYPGVIYCWDVVNEAVADYFWGGAAPMRKDDSMWYKTIGEEFVKDAFEYARKYTKQYAPDRKIKLFYNDYNEYFTSKRDGIIQLLKPVVAAGNIDGLGMQSHFDTDLPLEGDNGYMTAIRKFKEELGLEIHVTELDIGIAKGHTMEYQGAYFQSFMEALLKEKTNGANITSVTVWGLTDDMTWRAGSNCLLLNGDLSRKPAFDGVVNAIGRTQEVIDQIRSIQTVTTAPECKEKIEAARIAYDTLLTENQKKLVGNDQVLTEAEETYERLVKEEAEKEDGTKEDGTKEDGTKEDGTKEDGTKEDGSKENGSKEDGSKETGRISIQDAEVSGLSAQNYTGKKIAPSLKLSYQGKVLVKGSDYSISYKRNLDPGTAEVTISGKGRFEGSTVRKFKIIVKKNSKYTVGAYRYQVTNGDLMGKGTVRIVGTEKKSLKKIHIADTIKLGGKSFKVTEIGGSAFAGNQNLKTVTLGKEITAIGKKALFRCSKLEKITIKGAGLKKIGKNAIKGIDKHAVFQCPKKQLPAYKKLLKASTGWKKTMTLK